MTESEPLLNYQWKHFGGDSDILHPLDCIFTDFAIKRNLGEISVFSSKWNGRIRLVGDEKYVRHTKYFMPTHWTKEHLRALSRQWNNQLDMYYKTAEGNREWRAARLAEALLDA